MIKLVNPTGRNTNARVLELGNTRLFFSYETLIAVDAVDRRFRLPNYWGPTTGRHFNELGCKNFDTVEQADFDKLLMTYGLDMTH